jgi:hypothetical protein
MAEMFIETVPACTETPKQFEAMRWRSFLRRIDDTHLAVGLEVAKGDGPFEGYGETVLERQPD